MVMKQLKAYLQKNDNCTLTLYHVQNLTHWFISMYDKTHYNIVK